MAIFARQWKMAIFSKKVRTGNGARADLSKPSD